MAIRDAPYAAASVIYTITGLAADTTDHLEAALAAYIAVPESIEFRRPLGRRISSETIARASREAVIRVEMRGIGDDDLADLIVRTRRKGFGVLPTRILISDRAIAISVSHGVMDGGPILEYVTWLLTVAAGGTGKRDLRTPERFPMVRGLRKVGMAGIRAFRQERSVPRVGAEQLRPGLTLEDCNLTTIAIPADTLARITALPTSSPVTPTARLTSIAIGALRRSYRGSADAPVTVPVDLRRFVGNARVLGNFMGVASYATLLGSDWSPEAVTARLVESTSSGAAMVTGPHAFARWVAHWPSGRIAAIRGGEQASGAASVFVPLLSSRKAPPESAWQEGADRRIAIASVGAAVDGGTLVSILTYGRAVHLSIWDESGLFDIAGFGGALETEIAARESAVQIGGTTA